MTPQLFLKLLKSAASKWSMHNATRLGASLACYTLLSIAPLAVLALGVCSIVLKASAERQLLQEVAAVAGDSSAQAVRMLLANTRHANGALATAIALVTLFFGASGVFVELRDSLNILWEVPQKPSSTWRQLIWQRLVAFAMVLAVGLLLLISLLLAAAFAAVEKFFAGVVPLHLAVLGQVANFVVSLAAMTILFALIFKFVPEIETRWREVLAGAAATALLFEIGKALLAFYLGTTGVGSAYGAAGSLVALVVWVYYSAQIFFFGAALTRAYTESVDTPQNKTTPVR